MFWRKRKIQVQPLPDLSSCIYTVSEEDLSPGYEEVYVPFLAVSRDGEDVLVFARFIDGTTMTSLEEACEEVIHYVEQRYKRFRLTYRRLPCTYLSLQEKQAVDRVEQQLQRWIPMQENPQS